MSKPLLTADPVYQKIQQYYDANGSKINIKQLFENDPKRFDKFSLTLKTPSDGDILLVSAKSQRSEVTQILCNQIFRTIRRIESLMTSGSCFCNWPSLVAFQKLARKCSAEATLTLLKIAQCCTPHCETSLGSQWLLMERM